MTFNQSPKTYLSGVWVTSSVEGYVCGRFREANAKTFSFCLLNSEWLTGTPNIAMSGQGVISISRTSDIILKKIFQNPVSFELEGPAGLFVPRHTILRRGTKNESSLRVQAGLLRCICGCGRAG